MKIDSCIKNFIESYDAEAMTSIDNLSNEYGLVINKRTMKLFNIKESFDTFNECLNVYGKYHIKEQDKIPHEQAYNNTLSFIDTKIFEDKDVLYSDLPKFVKAYTEGVQKLLETVSRVKSDIEESGIDVQYSADINDFTDAFIERVDKRFTESMNKILMASGYTYNKNMKNGIVKPQKPIFI